MRDDTGPHDYSLDEGRQAALPGPLDAIVSMQAVREARDGARMPKLHSELSSILREGGLLLIADQANDGDRNEKHLLSVNECEAAFLSAAFVGFRLLRKAGDLALFAAARCVTGDS